MLQTKQLFTLREAILLPKTKEKKAKKKRFNKSNLFCQQLTSALLLLLKRHTMERPSEGHGEELQQTVRKLRT